LDLEYATEAFPAIEQAINGRNKNNDNDNYKGIQTQIDVTAELIQTAVTNLQL